MPSTKTIAILGCGNLGSAIALGLKQSGAYQPQQITLTRRNVDSLDEFREQGYSIATHNCDAVKNSQLIILALTPQHLNTVLDEIRPVINAAQHTVISVVSGASIRHIRNHLDDTIAVVRAMPNTAIAIRESMTCICAEPQDIAAQKLTIELFEQLGKTVVIHEDLMIPATALCACGTAFFLRAVRAASQGGTEIGFHAEDALKMAAQTAKGAAALLLERNNHPEREVDKVTTPQGCTIAGLNQMEHHGFSSSMIRGIVTSAEKAQTLYS